MKDTVKVYFGVLILIFLFILLLAGLQSCESRVGKEDFEKEIEGYSTIVVNGEEFQIKDIVEINYTTQYYEEDHIEIILSDGTKVIFTEGSYTLKK